MSIVTCESSIRSYYDELNIRLDEKPLQVIAKTPISDINRKALIKRANELAKKLIKGQKQEEGYFCKLVNTFGDKGAAQAGSYAGNLTVDTYGSGMINKAVDFFCTKAIGSSKMISTGMQLVITPKVLPYLTAFSCAAGGIALPAAIGMVSQLYTWLLKSGKYTLETLPPPDQLIRYESDDHSFYDALGNKLGDQEFVDLQRNVYEFDLISKILLSSREDVESVFNEALNNSDGHGKLDEEEIKEMISRLKEENRYAGKEGILPQIKQFARYTLPTINRRSMQNNQYLNEIQRSMGSLTTKLEAPSKAESGLYYDEKKGNFYVPTWIDNVLYYQAPKVIAVKISEKLKPELYTLSKKIRDTSALLTDVSREDLEDFYKIQNDITEAFVALHSGLAKHENEQIDAAFSESLVKVTKNLEIARANLTAKVN